MKLTNHEEYAQAAISRFLFVFRFFFLRNSLFSQTKKEISRLKLHSCTTKLKRRPQMVYVIIEGIQMLFRKN